MTALQRRTPISAREAITPEFIRQVCARLKEGERVRRALPDNGRLHIERPLPFLVVYRARPEDAGTAYLVQSEASYLITPEAEAHVSDTAQLLDELFETLTDIRGALLVVEIWTREEAPAEVAQPVCFRVVCPPLEMENKRMPSVARHLRDALAAMPLPYFQVEATLQAGKPAAPGREPLLSPEAAKNRSILLMGVEAPPIFRVGPEGPLYPAALWKLRRELSRALESAFAEFMRIQTDEQPEDFRALGRSAPVTAVWNADRALAEAGRRFNLLLAITPVNAESAWEAFCENNFDTAPTFYYRLLPFDPDLLKRQIYQIGLEKVEDPVLQQLLRAKRLELDRQITLLEDRNTPPFLPGSIALYGKVEAELAALARHLLNAIPPEGRLHANRDRRNSSRERHIRAEEFAELARQEIARLREAAPNCTAEVEIRADIPGVMVASGNLLIGETFSAAPERVAALLAHEVGTHIVTYTNGRAQRLQMLASGLPNYDALQEGTALLAEYLVGGLLPSRLRTLAGRVVAAHSVEAGADFVETFRLLRDTFGFPNRSAWNITMRVHRGGGFTKDAVYLRGLTQLLPLLAKNDANDKIWELLWSGKVSFEMLETVRELFLRGILKPNALRPAFLDTPEAQRRIERLRAGMSVLDLIENRSSIDNRKEDSP